MRRILPGFVVLLAISFLSTAGCTGAGKKGDGGKPAAKKGHPHSDKGPNGGGLVEWGEDEYHVEYVFDRDTKKATLYILDGETAAKVTPIAVETVTLTLTHVKPSVEIAAKAEPDKDDPKGKSSRFVAVHDALGEKGAFKGEVSAKIGDKPFNGDFEEKAAKKK